MSNLTYTSLYAWLDNWRCLEGHPWVRKNFPPDDVYWELLEDHPDIAARLTPKGFVYVRPTYNVGDMT